MPLSESQKQAVMHTDGPALVLAGPGSGKTTVITQRTRYLIEQCQIAPIHILVVTFSKAAALEMRERFLHLTGQNATKVRFGTFHSVFYEILKHAYHITGENIAGEEQISRFLREIITGMDLEIEDETDFLHDLIQEISQVKSEQIPLQHYYAKTVPERAFRSIYQAYVRKMEEHRLLDYDDLMVWTYQLFKERPDILAGWRMRYQYILVDEFQDINRLQYEIIRMLAAPKNNLFIVGDDDQSIYRFRGAKPEIMIQFPKEYPQAKQILLDQNFRCPGNVMDYAAKVIRRNTVRFEKVIRKVKEDGAPVECLLFQDPQQESLGIIRRISDYRKQGYAYREIAVLYRNNTDAIALSQKLMEYSVPFAMKDTPPNLFEHWIAKQVKAYLRCALGSRKRQDFLQIINHPKRYIGRECLDTPEIQFERLRCYYDDKYWVVQRIDKLEHDLHTLKSMEPSAAISYIRHGIGYEEYLEEYAQYRKMRPEELFEILDRLLESARGFHRLEEWLTYMDEYTKMLSEQKQIQKIPEDAITLTTLHSAKGLEFKVVFLIDVNDGVIPYRKAKLLSDVEEERRMFYVGLTRASQRLHICTIKEKYGKSLKPSPFLVRSDSNV